MILLLHNGKTVIGTTDLNDGQPINTTHSNLVIALFELAENYPNSTLVWCHESQKDNIDFDGISSAFYLKNSMLSYATTDYMLPQVGYVEDSPFIKVNKSVSYPTWMMSSLVGVIHASILIKFKDIIDTKESMDYVLNSIAKLGMKNGLFCYSEPKLVKNPETCTLRQSASKNDLFKFVKQHYKARWIPLLLLNYLWHEKQVSIFPLIKSMFYKQLKCEASFKLGSLKATENDENFSIDVIIPTIGRKQYLHEVLKNLSLQTLIPNKVVVVEQNPDSNSVTELDYIKNEEWPFEIIHHFIHQTGACNARNIGLKEIGSDYVFLADDDIRIKNNVLQQALEFMLLHNIKATTLSCLLPNQKEKLKQPLQWSAFGSGCSIVQKEAIQNLVFNMAFEHGFGEDSDFGMQLRNKGIDVIYYPFNSLLHLKAPIGGFRTRVTPPWEQDAIKPKPSPTVMLYRLNHTTKHQLLGYKTTLFFKFFKEQHIKNPFKYYRIFKKQWQQSVYWAHYLKDKNSG